MLGALLRLVVVLAVLAVAVLAITGYWSADGEPGRDAIGTTGERGLDPERARERGAAAGERVATAINEAGQRAAAAADRAGEALDDAEVTARIKAKMALDERVRAAGIDVDTTDGVVTLRGTVDSRAAHERALQLARETTGVRRVEDHLRVP